MKTLIASLLMSATLLPLSALAANGAPMGDKERIDTLLRQNQMLLEENAKLRAEREMAATPQQSFAYCMQAAKGLGAMAAESVGGHCSKILK